MSIEKFKIQRTGDDIYLKLNLGSDDAFAGAQQEIDNITETASIELINPLIDK